MPLIFSQTKQRMVNITKMVPIQTKTHELSYNMIDRLANSKTCGSCKNAK